MRTFEFPQEAAVIGEHHHVELVAMRVPDKNVTSICSQKVSNMLWTLVCCHLIYQSR